MNDCLFCKMIAGDIPCDIVYENKTILAFRDIDPKAPTHILVIPKKHVRSINELNESEQNLAGELLLTAKKIAEDEGIDESGFRTVFNTNSDGGQTVFHIHMHILGGRKMTWPPG
ncbi:MAG: histidine triad nucleotide-binding protein [Candidatus Marinimicrobia bacterium]|nr:histidine triad nucleotide-binding protein [Candidatus Neomarinimicrobiota bacterium]MBL7010450.1 histidine triad nucleotide-binding protein [Candidatus Neomarinimicrobiota bacterium]MBL7030054.1 histidine triad nucleotide-binding protein [Candidatus Neomarinimicrobiota bacterium]